MTTETESLLLLLAQMREAAALLTRAEDAITGAGEYLETDDLEILVGVAVRGAERIVAQLEAATSEPEQVPAETLHPQMSAMLKAVAADDSADLRRARDAVERAVEVERTPRDARGDGAVFL
jgi:hypothetical protein